MIATTRIALGSVVIGCLVLTIKYVAYLMTGSVALYSDALESIVNVATAIAALWAVHVAQRPADARHPYGHHKIEYFSAVLEGVLIIAAAFLILHEAYRALIGPTPLVAPLQGLLVNGLAGLINAVWCWVLISAGRRKRSPALLADGKHLLSDVASSAGILFGVFLAIETGWPILDPALAALVAINIIWSGWKVMKDSMSGLMDEAVPETTLEKIRSAISANAHGAMEAHDVRTRHAGKLTFIEFHLVVSSEMSVSDAHDICDRLEKALMTQIEDAFVTIHVEPQHEAKHSGIVVI